MKRTIQQFDRVRVVRTVLERNVGCGTVGIVLDVLGGEPARAFNVEVPDYAPGVYWFDSLSESDVEWVAADTPFRYVPPSAAPGGG
ncbi:MAG: hypothetical protein JO198_02990 [Candidatus Dormibacteraeota bacterium]|nr:hypothetical protein [Candidatus Dormibacteraeota bacterium]